MTNDGDDIDVVVVAAAAVDDDDDDDNNNKYCLFFNAFGNPIPFHNLLFCFFVQIQFAETEAAVRDRTPSRL